MNRQNIKMAAQQATLIQFGLLKSANAAQEAGAFRKFIAGNSGEDFAKRINALRSAGGGAALGGLAGAAVGAASNEDDRFAGALKGGLGGAALGGLAGGAHGYMRAGRAYGHMPQTIDQTRAAYLAGNASTRDAARGIAGHATVFGGPAVAKAAALSPSQIGGLIGAGVGGLGGYLSDTEADAQERLLRTLGGAALGGATGYGIGHFGFVPGEAAAAAAPAASIPAAVVEPPGKPFGHTSGMSGIFTSSHVPPAVAAATAPVAGPAASALSAASKKMPTDSQVRREFGSVALQDLINGGGNIAGAGNVPVSRAASSLIEPVRMGGRFEM
jgi:hypothetical protein